MSLFLGILGVVTEGMAIAAAVVLFLVVPLAALLFGSESEEPTPVDRWEEWP